VEGSSRDLLGGIIPAFTWRALERPKKFSARIAGVRLEIETLYFINMKQD
jgi:hypothetical protein